MEEIEVESVESLAVGLLELPREVADYAAEIRADRKAVAAQARREALELAAEHCNEAAQRWAEVVRDTRLEVIRLREAGKDYEALFSEEHIAASHHAEALALAESLMSLASPEGGKDG